MGERRQVRRGCVPTPDARCLDGNSACRRAVLPSPLPSAAHVDTLLSPQLSHLAVPHADKHDDPVVAPRLADAPRVHQRACKSGSTLAWLLPAPQLHAGHDDHRHLVAQGGPARGGGAGGGGVGFARARDVAQYALQLVAASRGQGARCVADPGGGVPAAGRGVAEGVGDVGRGEGGGFGGGGHQGGRQQPAGERTACRHGVWGATATTGGGARRE